MGRKANTAMAILALIWGAHASQALAGAMEERLGAGYWHAARDISENGETGFIYVDMKFHADGYWTQFYRSYLPNLSGCNKVGDNVVSFGKWQTQGDQVVVTGYHRDGQYWKKPATMRLNGGKLELVGGNTRFVPAKSIKGGYGCQAYLQGEFEQHKGLLLPDE
ncbi:conserved exported hypothetical protein [Pseudomonas sp. 9AZ]|uniref:hypothetical protein n=1 Tax=Pseudomonas sp. 9AZ TaxID=2653168 RepID=UPI0012F1C955|nr:hypothetical protein [Pseudomonas sp. 9AZ]VXD00286.1 conserved exported hypothetical protein [Pseudomonas sp. 9AZ]